MIIPLSDLEIQKSNLLLEDFKLLSELSEV
jgi:hypothetical protein